MSEACQTCGSSCSEQEKENCPSAQGAGLAKSKIKRVVGVMSGKGGVGKSTITALTALEYRRRGYQVGILDADITGPSIPRAFGIDHQVVMGDGEGAILPEYTKSGIKIISMNLLMENPNDPVVWRGPLLGNTAKQFWTDVAWGELDYLFVDLPPGTADVPLTVMQTLPLAGVIIVTSPQDLVRMVVRKSIRMAEMVNTPILGLIVNMDGLVCPHCQEHISVFGKNEAKAEADAACIRYLGSLPLDLQLVELADQGRIEEYAIPNAAPLVDWDA